MKRISLYGILSLLLLSACSSEEDTGNTHIDPPAGKGVAMCFGSALPTATTADAKSGAPTRATEKTKMADGDEVGVFAFSQGGKAWDEWTNRTANLMYNQLMTVSGDSALVYTPTRYWIPDSLYSFYAYYPYAATASAVTDEAEGPVITTGNIGKGSGMGSIVYHTPQLASQQKEFLVSDLITNQRLSSAATSASKVKFTLHHVLSELTFALNLSAFNTTNNTYTVGALDSVRLKNIATQGQLTSYSDNSTTTRVWTQTGYGTVLATDNNATFFLIPQSFNTDMGVYLYGNYTTTNSGTTGKVAVHANMVNDLKIDGVYAGIRQTYTLQPTDAHVLFAPDGKEYTIWSGSQSLSTNAVSIDKDQYLVSSMLKVGSVIKLIYKVANTTDSYQITINSGYSVKLRDSQTYQANDTSATYYEPITLTADDVKQFKNALNNSEPLFTVSASKDDLLTLTSITLIP